MSISTADARAIIISLRTMKANGASYEDLAEALGWKSGPGGLSPAKVKQLQRWTTPGAKLSRFHPHTITSLKGGMRLIGKRVLCENCGPYGELGVRLGSSEADLEPYLGTYFRYRRDLSGNIRTHEKPMRIERCSICGCVRALMPTSAAGVKERVGGVWLTQGSLQVLFVEARYTGLILVRATKPTTHALTGIMAMLE